MYWIRYWLLSQKKVSLIFNLTSYSWRTLGKMLDHFLPDSLLPFTSKKKKKLLILANACWLICPATPPLYSGIPPLFSYFIFSIFQLTVLPSSQLSSHTRKSLKHLLSQLFCAAAVPFDAQLLATEHLCAAILYITEILISAK